MLQIRVQKDVYLYNCILVWMSSWLKRWSFHEIKIITIIINSLFIIHCYHNKFYQHYNYYCGMQAMNKSSSLVKRYQDLLPLITAKTVIS